jgi:N-acetylglucosaminyldiphosphoundecaprenol N-acetyl-beta-D-mannosaminyltransferase
MTDPARVRVAGVEFDRLDMGAAIERIAELARQRPMSTVVTPNVDLVVIANRDPAFMTAIRRADLVLADGQPVVWASRLTGRRLPERVTGADLVPALVEVAEERGLRVFLLGGAPGVAERAAARLRTLAPGVVIVGTAGPPAAAIDAPDVIRQINDARPDLLFVGFGAPKQELWLERHRAELDVGVGIGVGASLDFAAGRVPRAPRWMQRHGLEWLFRLAREPRRLWRRYLVRDPAFAWYLVRDLRATRGG